MSTYIQRVVKIRFVNMKYSKICKQHWPCHQNLCFARNERKCQRNESYRSFNIIFIAIATSSSDIKFKFVIFRLYPYNYNSTRVRHLVLYAHFCVYAMFTNVLLQFRFERTNNEAPRCKVSKERCGSCANASDVLRNCSMLLAQ